MTRSAAVSIENTFNKGLITEATAMNYPENSVVSTDNCIFTKEGRVIRRYGVDYENNYVITPWTTFAPVSGAPTPSDYYSGLVIKEFEWTTVSNNGSITFIVVQLGNIINFFLENADNTFSANRKTFSINLNSYQVGTYSSDYGQYNGALECSFASGFGYLFVSHPLCDPFYVTYDSTADTISVNAITITVRDFERLNDSLATDARPGSLTDLHKYNLYNQGWFATAKNATPATANVLTYWDGARTDWPSNADIWYLFKNSSDLIDSANFDTKALGNTPAPNGHYTYNAFSISRDTTLGTTGLPAVSSNNARPSTVGFFAGRVWYAGTQSTGYASKIYFSKVVEGATDFGTCYQLADPTAEDINELQPTDGGVINIPEIGQVIRLVPLNQTLLVFATNGVWTIQGPNGVFSASDYSIKKITSIGTTAASSVIVAEGLPFWWNNSSIYTIQFDQQSNNEIVQNVSETTIQSFLNGIPTQNLPFIKSAYNSINKNIYWIYNAKEATTISDFYSYNKVLVFNLTTSSFSVQTVQTSTPQIAGVIFPSNALFDPLVSVKSAGLAKFLTVGNIGIGNAPAFTVSQFNRSDFYDWKIFDDTGVSYVSEFITGYRIRGDLLRKFQSNYIVVILDTDADGSCFLQGIWDYSNTTNNGRFTTSQQVYSNDSTYDYSRVKRQIRGQGYSLQFKFFSEEGKPFSLVGWTTSDTGNNIP